MIQQIGNAVMVGNVYKSKATGPKGFKAGTCYWLVVSVRQETVNQCGGCHMLGLDKDWQIVSSTSYSLHVMYRRQRLFRIKNVEQFALTLLKHRGRGYSCPKCRWKGGEYQTIVGKGGWGRFCPSCGNNCYPD